MSMFPSRLFPLAFFLLTASHAATHIVHEGSRALDTCRVLAEQAAYPHVQKPSLGPSPEVLGACNAEVLRSSPVTNDILLVSLSTALYSTVLMATCGEQQVTRLVAQQTYEDTGRLKAFSPHRGHFPPSEFLNYSTCITGKIIKNHLTTVRLMCFLRQAVHL